ncbi:LOW QUALITY PROTEIN: hypothetical protein V2J09_003447 [Rumex salicifolius]
MVDDTRLKTLEEHLKRNDAQIVDVQSVVAQNRDLITAAQSSLDETKRIQEEQHKMLEKLTAMVTSLLPKEHTDIAEQRRLEALAPGVLQAPNPANRLPEQQASRFTPEKPNPGGRVWDATSVHGDRASPAGFDGRSGFGRFPKVDFPLFDGTNPRSWIRRCERYFLIFQIHDAQKVSLASMYVCGKDEVWLQGFMLQNLTDSWSVLTNAILLRFGDLDGSDVVEEFNKLQQQEDLEEYNEKFEDLRASMLLLNPSLPESYFISSYVSGLRSEIKHLVRLGKPTSLALTFEHAKQQFNAVQALFQWRKPPWKPHSTAKPSPSETKWPTKSALPTSSGSSIGSSSKPTDSTGKTPISAELRESRRAAGLCYRCGDKYYVGHRCKSQALHSLFSIPVEEPEMQEEQPLVYAHQSEEDDQEVYVHALTGSSPLNTIKIKGLVAGKPIMILIDSGATHSFLDPRVLPGTPFEPNTTSLMEVAVANGYKLYSQQGCKDFKWEMQGHRFIFSPRILKLGGYDLVLGGDWLREFNPILFDFKALKISFHKDGHKLEFSGIREEAGLCSMTGLKLHKLFKKRVPLLVTQIARLFSVQAESVALPSQITELLDSFAAVFSDPVYRRTGTTSTLFLLSQELSRFVFDPINYLGHIISGSGVSTDPSKVSAMRDWPTPVSFRALRGFLGLTGYYRRFVPNYGSIARPLTEVLKADKFLWTDAANQSFLSLKHLMSSTLVLRLPDFSLPFVLETDACNIGIGAVLMQQGHPIAYISQALHGSNLLLATYEKELLAILLAVDKWRHYLEGAHFYIRTDHQPLRHLLDQRLTTHLQKKAVRKLLGLSYSISYKQGIENRVADALSRRDEPESAAANAISVVTPQWMSEIQSSYEGDSFALQTLAAASVSPTGGFSLLQGLLRFKGRLFIGSSTTLRQRLLEALHASPLGGHSGVHGTYQRLKQLRMNRVSRNRFILISSPPNFPLSISFPLNSYPSYLDHNSGIRATVLTMVDDTRLKTLEEHLKRNDAQIVDVQSVVAQNRDLITAAQSSLDETKRIQEEQHKMLEKLTAMVTSLLPKEHTDIAEQRRLEALAPGVLQAPNPANRLPEQQASRFTPERPNPGGRVWDATSVHGDRASPAGFDGCSGFGRFPKVDFPLFDGTNPRSWIRRCERYFLIFQIHDAQKNLTDSWSVLTNAILLRFGDLDGSDVVEEFNKLQQQEDLEEYNEKFEDLRASMLLLNPSLPESYFISSYVSGLRSEIKHLVRLGKPTSLALTFEHAKQQFNAVQALFQWRKPPWKPHSTAKPSPSETKWPTKSALPTSSGSSIGSSSKPTDSTGKTPISAELRESRRAAGLCYRCGDKYYVGHRCKSQALHSLFSIPVEEPEMQEEQPLVYAHQSEEDDQEVYVHALTGSSPLNTIKIKGLVAGKPIMILIDSGATHSFLDPRVLPGTPFEPNTTSLMEVAVANGYKLYSQQGCKDFKWEMQGHRFIFSPRILKLGGYDLVLGGDWLREFSPILFDFKALKISFHKDGHKLEFSGIREEAGLRSMTGLKLHKLFKKRVPLFVTQIARLFSVQAESVALPSQITELLDSFAAVFSDPVYRRTGTTSTLFLLSQELSRFVFDPINYLGHIISGSGVSTDPSKVSAMRDWPTPVSFRALRGFLGLTGYYRRFVPNYGSIARPLTEVLKADKFLWTDAANQSFLSLKHLMSSTLVLRLPDFSLPFVLETDACNVGIGAVLMQQGHPIAYISQALHGSNLLLATYEKELLAILLAVDKWRHYLEGAHFYIRTDHQPLRHLLDQRLTTHLQKKAVRKLLGLSYSISYKQGIENRVADALSRRDEPESAAANAISVVTPQWMSEIQSSYEGDSFALQTLAAASVSPTGGFSLLQGLLRFKGRLFIGSSTTLRQRLLEALHASPLGGHSGVHGTYQRLKQLVTYSASGDPTTEWLIRWTNLDVSEATWEPAGHIISQFPSFSNRP